MYSGTHLPSVALLRRAFSKGKKAAGQAEPLDKANAEGREAFPVRAVACGEICKATSALARPSLWLQTRKTHSQRLSAIGKSSESSRQSCQTFLYKTLLRP